MCSFTKHDYQNFKALALSLSGVRPCDRTEEQLKNYLSIIDFVECSDLVGADDLELEVTGSTRIEWIYAGWPSFSY